MENFKNKYIFTVYTWRKIKPLRDLNENDKTTKSVGKSLRDQKDYIAKKKEKEKKKKKEKKKRYNHNQKTENYLPIS